MSTPYFIIIISRQCNIYVLASAAADCTADARDGAEAGEKKIDRFLV